MSISIISPADGDTITAQSAGMMLTVAYGYEAFIVRWRRLVKYIASPADGDAIRAQAAGMLPTLSVTTTLNIVATAAADGYEPLIFRR